MEKYGPGECPALEHSGPGRLLGGTYNMAHDRYISPFSTRYSSDEMQYIFSDDNKFRTWRRLWIALAKAEKRQGLDITDEQIAQLEGPCR